MNQFKYVFALCVICFTITPAFGQSGKIKKGDKLYENMVYPAAIRVYEKALKKEKNLGAMEKLADSYRQVGKIEEAEKWYGEVVKDKAAAPINKLYYGEMLKSNGKYDEARNWFEAYLQTGENPQRAARFIESCDFAKEALKDSSRYAITEEAVNTSSSDFNPMIYGQGLMFVSERKHGFALFRNLRNNNNFYDLFYSERANNKNGFKVKHLKGKINSKYHDGPAVLSPDRKQLYFTRSYYVVDKKGKSGRVVSRLKIGVATYDRKKFRDIQFLPFNSQEYSCMHPAISADGNTMIFASDIPGGFGGTDLYMSTKDGDKWSTPQNLGSTVNTEGNEGFPYMHQGGALFFASDGHSGLGGLDIFSAAKEGSRYAKPVNCGYPLNTSRDDFTITWIRNKSAGYFSSNRKGEDDIYRFRRKLKVTGTLVDSRTGRAVESAQIAAIDQNGREDKFMTDKDGKFSFLTDWGKDYQITASKSQYIQTREQISTKKVSPMDDMEVTMQIERDLIFTISGKVTDAASSQPIENATVRVISNKDKPYRTAADGTYSGTIP
ncbi:MAG: carboxypeptidase regulatory-like domain-containing protein, partial [Bacteroidota bacterium]